MPTVNLAIINVTTGEFIDWMPGVRGGYRFIYTPREAYANHNFKIVMSGEERTTLILKSLPIRPEG